MSAATGVLDRDGCVTHWSSGAQELLGYAPVEIIGRPVDDLLTAEGTLRHRDGLPLHARVHLCPLQDTDRDGGFLLLLTAVPEAATDTPRDSLLPQWIFEQQPLAVAICDLDARLLRGNEPMLGVGGFSEEEARGRRLTEILQGNAIEEVERRVLRVARTGKAEAAEPIVRLPGESKAHAWAMDVFPLKDADGSVRAVGVTASDYSQQYDSRERIALISEARTRVGTSLDIVGTAREFAELAVPRFADFVSVDLLEPVFQGELPAPVLPRGVTALRRAAHRWAAGHVPALDAVISATEVHPHPWSSPVARCLAESRAVRHSTEDPEVVRWLAEDPVQASLAESFGPHSLIAVPIRAQGVSLGVVLFVRYAASHEEAFGPDCTAISEDLVDRLAICLDNARRFTRERGIALALQRALLPRESAVHPAVETAARYLPAGGGAQVGGDWFDVVPLPGARVGLVVGDVVGHGINASATMGRLRTAVRTLADIDLPPEELLTHLDDIITHTAGEQGGEPTGEIPGDIGATCLYAVYDPVSGTCSLARAGHPAPVLIRPDGTSSVIDMPCGPPLGLGSLPFEAADVIVPEGGLLALFTNGLLSTRDRDIDEGFSDLRRALALPAASLDALCDTVLDTLCPEPHADDVTLLLARPRVFDEDRLASWDLPGNPAVVADARRLAAEQLALWGLAEAAFVTQLVVSELVTNAMRHAGGPIRLRLIKGETLICEVSDGSSVSPHLRRARVFDEGGRGLFMVAQITQRWGTRYTRTGKTIWGEQVLHMP
ncbi:SpoIIE family protein phosphatase [Streptomyces hyaluromycini]|uniref:SpoIIE family protein phosphatase n=1 Tax=Streptomyces hyaluromycini TaxID=1377993 RepID=UPI001FE2880F|nr:SpoIIE family protein phosphatase [Streptomyces hyaluromycini]